MPVQGAHSHRCPTGRSTSMPSPVATWILKRCLSRWLERDVMRNLNVAAPCSATTSVSPTSSGSDRLVCGGGAPVAGASAGMGCDEMDVPSGGEGEAVARAPRWRGVSGR
eukprot:scaffold23996_cov84-Isochrysis_galbana.AAC.1